MENTSLLVSQLAGLDNGPPKYEECLGKRYSFYLSGPVELPDYYVDWFYTIRNAGPNDEIIIHINSMGGNMDTAIQFIRVMSESQAYITTSVEGSCMSAATLIFLAGHTFQITPFSLFMFHNYSGAAVGKGGEMYDNIVFERKWSTEFLHWAYKDFLTQKEIDTMLDNKDIWMTYTEVVERCKRLIEIRKNANTQSCQINIDMPEDTELLS